MKLIGGVYSSHSSWQRAARLPFWRQSTAQISGQVKDETGAVLPGVEVTASQTATGATRKARRAGGAESRAMENAAPYRADRTSR
jgi:hypothetical protein